MNLSSVVDRIRALVALPSASSFDPMKDEGNQKVIDLLSEWLESLGFFVEQHPLEGPAARSNLIARLGDGPGGLVLSGHADTVACEKGRWSSDPYALTEKNGRFYGLGAADMKSFFAVALEAIRSFSASSLREPLYLVATADEECAMQGIHELVQLGKPKARYAIVGEPTGLEPIRMHKGMMMTRVRTIGRSGHSSAPEAGANALDAMIAVCNEMIAWREELARNHRDEGFQTPIPTLNLGTMHAGDHPNRICGECVMQMDLRPLPGMDPRALRKTMVEKVEKAVEGRGVVLEIDSLFPGTIPMHTPKQSPLVLHAEKLTGKSASSAGYGTEAPHFSRLGMDTIVLGPASIAQAHQPDEFIEASQLEPAVEIYQNMIEKFCVQTE